MINNILRYYKLLVFVKNIEMKGFETIHNQPPFDNKSLKFNVYILGNVHSWFILSLNCYIAKPF